jgi:hypothetical protein
LRYKGANANPTGLRDVSSLRQTFNEESLALVRREIERLRGELTFQKAKELPPAEGRDVVIAGREVQLTIFRQSGLAFLDGDVLVTVQVARFGLGGTNTFRLERGLVFSSRAPTRDATENELAESGSGAHGA